MSSANCGFEDLVFVKITSLCYVCIVVHHPVVIVNHFLPYNSR